jgi:hypothetical protein
MRIAPHLCHDENDTERLVGKIGEPLAGQVRRLPADMKKG